MKLRNNYGGRPLIPTLPAYCPLWFIPFRPAVGVGAAGADISE